MRSMLNGLCAGIAMGLALLASPAAAQDLVVNGGFESGLANWGAAPSTTGSASGTCGYNPDAPPGTEALTGLPGFTTTNPNLALGSVSLAANGYRSCVLYQDIAIPAGATTLSLSGDFGIRTYGGLATGDTAIFVGLYPTTSVPNYQQAFLGGNRLIVPGANSTALSSRTPVNLNVSAYAGTTLRLSVILAMQSQASGTGPFLPGAGAVVGASNVRAVVAVAARPSVASLSPASGSATGGTSVIISGANFTGATAVTFAGVPATSFVVNSGSQITAVAPAGTAGSAEVRVTSPSGVSADAGTADNFTYTAPAAPIPTLSEWAMIILGVMLAAGAGLHIYRRHSLIA